ncbi:MAG: RNA polymerase-binding protein RbpA [Corynebacteriales bacterium]|nr:RNA polymerase-binding protein RbpA [Mycobacteriales bacterium]
MAGSTAIRGTRVGSGPMGENERGESAPRRHVTFFCAKGHVSTPSFSLEVEVPETWDCPRCGLPAGQNQAAPPPEPRIEPYKTHLAYVRERRSDEDGAAILEEALARLRARRGDV